MQATQMARLDQFFRSGIYNPNQFIAFLNSIANDQQT
jgi:hypothetical protein